ncbi:restriction endonuclease subunit S [Psychrobacter sp. AOP5-GZ1-6]|uniref:restriction endonuclease subunit S n=1 Tax=Psychrobacter sp. AOP5-GZ1-6 TaxID=3457649 RepID=UPI00402B70A7
MSEVRIPEGYKQTEVGVIPQNWETKNIGKDATLKARIGWQALTTNEYQSTGNYYLVTGTDFNAGEVQWDTCWYVDEWRYKQDLNIQLRIDDVLVTKDGTIGKVGYVDELPKPATLNSGVFVIRPKYNSFVPKYFFYVLTSNLFKEFIRNITAGSTITHLYQKDFVTFNFPVPPKKEQTAIATALSDVDNLIGSLEKLIAKKEAIKTGTMQQLLTGKTRLPEFATREDGSAKGFKQTELGRIPEDWDLVELRDLLSYEQPTKYIIDGNEFLEDGTTPVLTAGKSFILGYTEEAHGIYRSLPTIIFDDFTTATQFVNFPFKVKSSAMKILKPKSTSVPIQLIYLLLSNIDYKVGDHKRHWISEFSSLKVRLPNSSIEQNAIATILSDMDAEIQALQQRLEKTRDIKQGMMQQLLTGKVRLAH